MQTFFNKSWNKLIYLMLYIIIILFCINQNVLADYDWEFVEHEGYSFEYPHDWEYVYTGQTDLGGINSYLIEIMGPNDEINCGLQIMLMPNFPYDMQELEISFEQFVQMSFDSALESMEIDNSQKNVVQMEMNHGMINAFEYLEEAEGSLRLFIMCGDLIGVNAVIFAIAIDSGPGQEMIAQVYMGIIEQIVRSLNFPN